VIFFMISVVPPKMDSIAATIWVSQTRCRPGSATASASPHRER
jgi:hypothetical protein